MLPVSFAVAAKGNQYRLELAPGATEETVFDWSKERCEEWHIPDAPLRSFRDDKGEVVAFASNYKNRALVGPDLAHIATRCSISLQARTAPMRASSAMSWIRASDLDAQYCDVFADA